MTSSLWAGTAVDGFTGYDGMDEGGGGVGYDGVNEGGGGAGEAEQHAPEGVNMEQDSHASLGPASSLRISTELGRQAGSDHIQWLLQGAVSTAAGEEPSASASSLPGASWAGASHWRYRAAPAGAGEVTSRPAAGGRRKKAAVVIDFENLDPLPPGAFDLAPNAAISLKSRAAVNTLLPPDLHYQASMLRRLFLKPLSAVARCAAPVEAAGADEEDLGPDDGFDPGQGNDDDDSDAGGWGDTDFGAAADGEGSGLAAPRKVQQITVNYARSSKQVDVRALKESLWDSMQHVEPEGDTGQHQTDKV
eukprot:jgi/Astpho2/7928/Aster-x0791